MRAVRKEAPAQRVSRADDDAYFNALRSPTFEELSPEQRAERWNKEHYKRFISPDMFEEFKSAQSANGNHIRQGRAKDRRQAIIAIWPDAWKEHPRNRDDRLAYILKSLESLGFKIGEGTLVCVDLPRLRKDGLI